MKYEETSKSTFLLFQTSRRCTFLRCTIRDMTLVLLKTASISFNVPERPVSKKQGSEEKERDILTVDCDFYCFGVRRGDVIQSAAFVVSSLVPCDASYVKIFTTLMLPGWEYKNGGKVVKLCPQIIQTHRHKQIQYAYLCIL